MLNGRFSISLMQGISHYLSQLGRLSLSVVWCPVNASNIRQKVIGEMAYFITVQGMDIGQWKSRRLVGS